VTHDESVVGHGRLGDFPKRDLKRDLKRHLIERSDRDA
jgi:hypothetical protein